MPIEAILTIAVGIIIWLVGVRTGYNLKRIMGKRQGIIEINSKRLRGLLNGKTSGKVSITN